MGSSVQHNIPDPRNAQPAIKKGPAQAARQGAPGINTAKRPEPAGAGSKLIHGAEALMTLVVAESRHSRFKSNLILGLIGLVVILAIAVSVQSASRPEPKILGLDNKGQVIPLPLLDQPYYTAEQVTSWVKEEIPELYKFSYSDYREQLNKHLSIMRPATLQAFVNMLSDSGILPKVREESLNLRAVPVNNAVIHGEGKVDGVHVWVTEIPLDLIYDSGVVDTTTRQRKQIVQPIVFRAWVARASLLEFKDGKILAKFEVLQRNR